jgi:hypothetical protein
MHYFMNSCLCAQSDRQIVTYHDNENHDYEHEKDWKTFHAVKVHYIHHPRQIATSFGQALSAVQSAKNSNNKKRPKNVFLTAHLNWPPIAALHSGEF